MKIIFVIAVIGGGGAEREVSRMANYWAEHGHQVSILSYEKEKNPNAFPLHPTVQVELLDLLGWSGSYLKALTNNFHRFFKLRRAIRAQKPNVVIAYMDDISVMTCLVSIVGKNYLLVLKEIAHPDFFTSHWVWQKIKTWAFGFGDKLILQTEAVKTYYQNYKIEKHIIPNALSLPPDLPIDYAAKRIVSVGRLDKMKNFPMLIRAFLSVRTEGWQLHIFGQGDEWDNLNRLVAELSAQDFVLLRGFSKTVQIELAQASIFAFPSLTEGYPNALIEAMSQGLACVSTDCPFGPSEIIEPQINGLLVPNGDENAFAEALKQLMLSQELRQNLGQNALAINEKLSMETIMKQWEQLIFNKL